MTAPVGAIARIFRVDQAMARKFLSFEKQPEKGVRGTNRKFSAVLINRYAFEMLAGRWKYTHEGMAFIGFMNDGTADFKDGGQRCRAIIQAATVGAKLGDESYPPNPDIAIDVMVSEGLDEDSWRAMNIGKPKRPADFMAMDGEVNTSVLTAVIALCSQYEREPKGAVFLRDRWGRSFMTPIQRQEYLDANPGIREAIYEGSRLSKVMTVSSAAAGYYLATKVGVDKGKLGDFMDLLYSGANMHQDHPALRLRELLKNAKLKFRRRNLPREDQLALFIKAFNAFSKGHDILNLSFRTTPSSRGGSEMFPRFQV